MYVMLMYVPLTLSYNALLLHYIVKYTQSNIGTQMTGTATEQQSNYGDMSVSNPNDTDTPDVIKKIDNSSLKELIQWKLL